MKLRRLIRRLLKQRERITSRQLWIVIFVAVLIIAIAGVLLPTLPARAKQPAEEASAERVTYEWFLLQWSNRQVVCTLLISHEGSPTNSEIQARCGNNVYDNWVSTSVCQGAVTTGDTSQCQGLYMIFNDVFSWSPVDTEPLSAVGFEASLLGCIPEAPNNWCADRPTLIITTETSLAYSPVTRIDYKIGPDLYSCPQAVCEIPLEPTTKRGALIQFWAVDADGKAGFLHELRYRLLDTETYEIITDNGEDGFIVDIVGSALQGNDGSCCSLVWNTFRPIEAPLWLTTPAEASLLASRQRYYYLAGRLIKNGLSDPGTCANGGLQANGYATECGLSLALSDVMDWQNQYDALIIDAATETGVPAQLLKNLFAQESQMWPADYAGYEFGLGHITESGTDTLLMWNYDFFIKFCTLQFGFSSECRSSYTKLTTEDQRILMGLVLNLSTAYCADCPYGLEQNAVPFAVAIFAETLKANAYQAGQIIRNVTGQEPGEVTTYEDLWRFTLVNYTAGPGCLATAVDTTVRQGRQLNWSNLQWGLTDACDEAIDYVNEITGDIPAIP